MCDPLEYWFGNSEILESLCSYLSLTDIGHLSMVSTRWRNSLNVDHIWYKLCRRIDPSYTSLFGKVNTNHLVNVTSKYRHFQFQDHADKCHQDNDTRLESLCDWRHHLGLCQGARRRWRRGGEVVQVLETGDVSGEVRCYDCHDDTLVLGTHTAHLISWSLLTGHMGHRKVVMVKQAVDKVYTRHNMIIVMQGGLLQVFTALYLNLVYCKSVEKSPLSDHGQDDYYLPSLSPEELIRSYKPTTPVKYSDYDITVSTLGRPLLCVTSGSENKIRVYNLLTGDLEDIIEADDIILKIGLVPYEPFSSYMYLILRDSEHRLVGTMCNIDSKVFVWRLHLDTVFSYDHSVYSVYTKQGMLMFGHAAGDTCYPYTWTWRGWSYEDMSVFYSHSYETEYHMCLADWSDESVVTPRCLSYLHHDQDTLAFTQHSHRGIMIITYSWNNRDKSQDRRLWKASCGSKLKTSSLNIPLVASDVGGVLVTSQESQTLTLRNLETGVKMRDIKLETEVEVMWSDGLRIVLISKHLDKIGSVTVISFS